ARFPGGEHSTAGGGRPGPSTPTSTPAAVPFLRFARRERNGRTTGELGVVGEAQAGLEAAGSAEAFHELGHRALDGTAVHPHPAGDLVVTEPLGHEADDQPFLRGEFGGEVGGG